jgi:hypothetical protein
LDAVTETTISKVVEINMLYLCWFSSPEESKRMIKKNIKEIVDELHRLNRIGEPIGWELEDIHILLDHMYDPESCTEKRGKKNYEKL